MSNLTIEREKIVEKIRGIDDSTPSLEEQLASLKAKRTQLLTEIALQGGNNQGEDLALLDQEIASISSEIDDNKDVVANLRLRLCKAEKEIRISEMAQGEMEYVQSLKKLSTLTEDIEKAYLAVEEAVTKLHSLGQEYWDHRTKRKILSDKFIDFMAAEQISVISARISIAALVEDDSTCKEIKCRLSEIINEKNPGQLSTKLITITPFLII